VQSASSMDTHVRNLLTAAVNEDGGGNTVATAVAAPRPQLTQDDESCSMSSNNNDDNASHAERQEGASAGDSSAANQVSALHHCADTACTLTFSDEGKMKTHFNTAHAPAKVVASGLMLSRLGQCGSCRKLFNITSSGVLTYHRIRGRACAGASKTPAVGRRAHSAPGHQSQTHAAQAAAAVAALGQGTLDAPFIGQIGSAPVVLKSEADWKPHAVYLSEHSWLSAWSTMLGWYATKTRSGDVEGAEGVIKKLLLTPLDVPRQHGGIPRRHRGATDGNAADQPDPAPIVDAPATAEDERMLAKVLRTLDFLGRGLTQDALKALTSNALLEITAERMVALQALHPAPLAHDTEGDEDEHEGDADGDSSAHAASPGGVAGGGGASHLEVGASAPEEPQQHHPSGIQVTAQDIASYCRGREKKACDYFGFAARHALKLITCLAEDARDAFTDIIQRVADGNIHDPELIDMLRHVKGHPLDKGNGAIRPAGSICMLMHLASGILMRSVRDSLSDAVGRGNLGGGVKGGTEALARFLQIYAERFPNHAIVKLDWKNAFNAVRRAALIKAADSVPQLVAIARMHLGGDATVTYVDGKGKSHDIIVKTGGIQGDSKMSFLFSKSLNHVIAHIRAELRNEFDREGRSDLENLVVIVCFVDDTYICGPPTDVIAVVKRTMTAVRAELDLEAQPTKSAAHIPAGATPADTAAFAAAHIPVVQGIDAVGTPIGTPEFVNNFLEERVQRLDRLASRVIALKAQSQTVSKPVSLQGLFAITRLCIPATFSHLLRTVYPSVILPYAQRVDEIVVRTALQAGGLPVLATADPEDSERQRTAERLFLPVPMGGMGLYRCSANSRAAFLGGAKLTCDTVRDLGMDATKPEVAQLPYVREHREALEWIQQHLPDCAEIEKWTLGSIFGASEPKIQRFIMQELAKADLKDILASFPDSDAGRRKRAEFMECGEPKAGAWVQARASDTLCVLTNGEFWVGFAMRLGLAHRLYPEVSPNAICKACNCPVGHDLPAHAFGPCSKPARRGRNLRHTAIKNRIATCERTALPGTTVIMEPSVFAVTGVAPTAQKYARSRADIFSRPPNSLGYVIDVTVVDATSGPAPATNTSYKAGKGTEQAFDNKMTKYTQKRFKLTKSQFRAAAFDIRGAPSTSTLRYLKELKLRESESNRSIPRSVIASRLYQRVSVAIIQTVAINVMEFRLLRVPVAVPVAGPLAGPVAVAAD